MAEKSIPREIAQVYAQAIANRPNRCPWNPFPRDSDWGRKIDEMYYRQQARRRRSNG